MSSKYAAIWLLLAFLLGGYTLNVKSGQPAIKINAILIRGQHALKC
jgi:hypothetical protein